VAVLKRRPNQMASTMHTKGMTSSLATCTASDRTSSGCIAADHCS
jgi:hypothetical protein